VAISTVTVTTNSSATASNTTIRTSPTITVKDVVNSTYIASKDDDESSSERRMVRAIRDRINDLLHTVVSTNATITSTTTITNDFVREVTIINNNTRLLEEVLPAQLGVALDRIRALGSVSQTANSTLELHTDVEMMCIANSTSLANCDVNMRIR
jgi:peptidoglycan hydrolase CwlO-like protein